MRTLNRNKQTLWYANYSSTEILEDEYGNELGTKVIYGKPASAAWNVGVIESDAEVQMFGVNAVDVISVVAEKDDFPLTETSVLWYGVTPEIKQDGTTDTAFNYRVVGIRRSLNELRFYAQKINITQVVETPVEPEEPPVEDPPPEGDGA